MDELSLTIQENQLINDSNDLETDFQSKCSKKKEIAEQSQLNSDYLDKLFYLDKENRELRTKVESLTQNIVLLESETSRELHAIQIETAGKEIEQQKNEIARLTENARQELEVTQTKFQQLENEFMGKTNRLSKQLEQAVKERDAMVMKYAVSENSVIALQRTIKQLESRVKDFTKEKESLTARNNAAADEKIKLALIIDGKNNDIQQLEREVQKEKDELHAQSSNLKFFQNKLKSELESHKDTQNKLEKTLVKLNQAKEETEQIRKDSQKILHQYETDGRKVLEMQDAAEVTSLQELLDACKQKNSELITENNMLCKMVQNLETERLEFDNTLSKLKHSSAQLQQCQIDEETARGELKSTRMILTREQERLSSMQAEMDRLRQINADTELEMGKCREREAELLSFTQMLTEKNVATQSDLSSLDIRLQQIQIDSAIEKSEIERLSTENESLTDQLRFERKRREEEIEMLARHLTEKTETSERQQNQIQDYIGEMQLMKKKHLSSIKELNRELQTLRKKESMEMVPLCQGSHTSSSTSINTLESNESHIPPLTQPLPTSVEPDRQILIEKVVRVQRSNARKQEKIEFLEEHARQLVVELQKKSKIIQGLILKHQTGALVSDSMDENKMVISKHGGIMASVYSSTPVDGSITLQLSLEINRKLQAVLEDTLLKNMTLKENIETLGNEIARLASRIHNE